MKLTPAAAAEQASLKGFWSTRARPWGGPGSNGKSQAPGVPWVTVLQKPVYISQLLHIPMRLSIPASATSARLVHACAAQVSSEKESSAGVRVCSEDSSLMPAWPISVAGALGPESPLLG